MWTKSFDIVPDPTHVITVPVAKLEPQWLRIYVGGDDDADACARTRAHAHADAVDDADADAGAYAHACAYAWPMHMLMVWVVVVALTKPPFGNYQTITKPTLAITKRLPSPLWQLPSPVSYTHLTLPTIYSV